MSLRSLFRGIWDDPWEGMNQPSRIFDQHFGGMLPMDDAGCLFNPSNPNSRYYRLLGLPRLANEACVRQAGVIQPPQQTGISEVVSTDKEFRVCMDVSHFQPDEISIKTRDNRVVINARHEERPDEHGFIMREFSRSYVLPKDVDPASVTSSLSRDGVLTLKAPKMALEEAKERVIPITQEESSEETK
ncbi:hypothetical protein ACOMHN_003931 [Nucella lapillus]